jgi:hypothetical protein
MARPLHRDRRARQIPESIGNKEQIMIDGQTQDPARGVTQWAQRVSDWCRHE